MTHTEASTPSNATTSVQAWLQALDDALQAQDIQRVLTLFNHECYWRDFLSFTWNLKTCEGKQEIQA
ncbi:MAG: NAD(P)/FAD-dependent oxidoreductase, partial [Halomonas sp.]|nr:NAD(P)/FAD-dependent oxidoreductase [Halomonas sp.]